MVQMVTASLMLHNLSSFCYSRVPVTGEEMWLGKGLTFSLAARIEVLCTAGSGWGVLMEMGAWGGSWYQKGKGNMQVWASHHGVAWVLSLSLCYWLCSHLSSFTLLILCLPHLTSFSDAHTNVCTAECSGRLNPLALQYLYISAALARLRSENCLTKYRFWIIYSSFSFRNFSSWWTRQNRNGYECRLQVYQ